MHKLSVLRMTLGEGKSLYKAKVVEYLEASTVMEILMDLSTKIKLKAMASTSQQRRPSHLIDR